MKPYLTWRFAEVIWRAMDVHFAHIAQIHQYIGYVLKVGSGAVSRGIDPLHHLGITPARYVGLHAGCVVRRPCCLIVVQLYVVDPAVDHGNDQLLEVQPEIVPVVRLLAHEVRRVGFVQTGVQLGASIAGH